ncbi:ceramide synthase 5-like [Tribolium madens]|uniref:ceramide synthase 5-like n=1 Tax=Tribolium madens TaxID=41895 RepID=UPI001CF72521|nr:ceramide synthase 5-like [Tribolium madens]
MLNFDLQIGDSRKRNYWELTYPILLTPFILLVRIGLEKFVFPKFVNPLLEKTIQKSTKWNSNQAQAVSKNCLKNRINLRKLNESLWRLVYYSSVCAYVLWVLWDKPWFWDSNNFWIHFYSQSVSTDIWCHFMICTAYMWTALWSIYFDINRKDFFLMLIHHIGIITTSFFVWKMNVIQMYSVALLLHDLCDIFLEIAKTANYLGCKKGCNVALVVFTGVWIVCRFGLYPNWVIRRWLVDAHQFLPDLSNYLAYYIMTGCLFTYVLLNSIWTVSIIKIVVRNVCSKTGKD